MSVTRLQPEHFDVANAYLQFGTVEATSQNTGLPQHTIVSTLNTPEVKRYLDGIYLDLGYRNKSKLGELLDKIIDQKIEEAQETGVYTSKDLVDLIQLAHKMRIDEIKANKDESTTVNIGGGNYKSLMDRLMN